MIPYVRFLTPLVTAGLMLVGSTLYAQDVRFPSDAGLIDVTQPPYNAAGDGETDDTAAIQQAFDDHMGKNNTLYFPDGTYLLSDQVGVFDAKPHSRTRFVHIQGQSEAGTIIKLQDNADGFDDPTNPKVVFSLYEGKSTGDAMHTMVQNFTLEVGAGNPGAAGLRYLANNSGSVYDVTIRSSDPEKAGAIGLDLRQSQQGPALIKRVTVDGFDHGIELGNSFSMVFEHITLTDQRKIGFYNPRARVTIRGLTSENRVPAVVSERHANMTLIEAQLAGGGADEPAIYLDTRIPRTYLRDIEVSGYARTVEIEGGEAVEGNIDEWWEGKSYSLFGAEPASLRLPIEETPQVPWEQDLSKWVKVESEGEDVTEALQSALDRAAAEGKTTIYFPRGREQDYVISRPVRVHGSVNRIIGLENIIRIDGSGELGVGADVFTFEDLDGPVVVERFFNFLVHDGWKGYRDDGEERYLFRNKSDQPIILKNFAHGACRLKKPQPDTTWFIEDVVGPLRVGQNEKVWARQFNPESPRREMLVVDGGQVWILGMKTEGRATHIDARNGARVELLGGVAYQSWKSQPLDPPMFIVDAASEASFTIGFYHFNLPFTTIVEETRDGETRRLERTDLEQYHLPIYRADRVEP